MKRIFVSILCLAVMAGSAYSAKKPKQAKPKKIKESVVVKSVNPVTPETQLKMGQMYLTGEQVKQNYGKAKKWFFKSAMAGNLQALENLGMIYKDGHGGWNYKKLFRQIDKNANAGNEKVYTNLGYLYRGGFGLKKEDYAKAVNWFRKSAEAGQASGMYYMGWMTYNGFGTTQDYNEAIRWYTKAAEHGYADAQYKLSQLYTESPAVGQDYVEAYKWLLIAEKNGRNVFEDKYMLEKKMTTEQITEAKDRTAN